MLARVLLGLPAPHREAPDKRRPVWPTVQRHGTRGASHKQGSDRDRAARQILLTVSRGYGKAIITLPHGLPCVIRAAVTRGHRTPVDAQGPGQTR